MALTVAEVRARVETDLEDAPLQRIIDGAEQAIDRAAGKSTALTQAFSALGALYISMPRRSSAISEIRERASVTADEVTLAANDWRKVGDYKVQRLGSGDNGASSWGAQVEVDYTPEVDADLRDRVALDLCQLEIVFKGLEREKVGDYEMEQKDYRKNRRSLLAQVREGRSPVL